MHDGSILILIFCFFLFLLLLLFFFMFLGSHSHFTNVFSYHRVHPKYKLQVLFHRFCSTPDPEIRAGRTVNSLLRGSYSTPISSFQRSAQRSAPSFTSSVTAYSQLANLWTGPLLQPQCQVLSACLPVLFQSTATIEGTTIPSSLNNSV